MLEIIDKKIELVSEELDGLKCAMNRAVDKLREYVASANPYNITNYAPTIIEEIRGYQRRIDTLNEVIRVLVWMKEDVKNA